jgi:hypothetical protein
VGTRLEGSGGATAPNMGTRDARHEAAVPPTSDAHDSGAACSGDLRLCDGDRGRGPKSSSINLGEFLQIPKSEARQLFDAPV